jgi:hypothetical protein
MFQTSMFRITIQLKEIHAEVEISVSELEGYKYIKIYN